MEVDGKQHFDGRMHNTLAVQQYTYDRYVDSFCLQGRLRLVRLHYRDRAGWVQAVKDAIADKTRDATCCFVKYTQSYILTPTYDAGSC